jgi:hypothetical protein
LFVPFICVLFFVVAPLGSVSALANLTMKYATVHATEDDYTVDTGGGTGVSPDNTDANNGNGNAAAGTGGDGDAAKLSVAPEDNYFANFLVMLVSGWAVYFFVTKYRESNGARGGREPDHTISHG